MFDIKQKKIIKQKMTMTLKCFLFVKRIYLGLFSSKHELKIIDLLRERSQIKYKKMNLFSFINNNRKMKLWTFTE